MRRKLLSHCLKNFHWRGFDISLLFFILARFFVSFTSAYTKIQTVPLLVFLFLSFYSQVCTTFFVLLHLKSLHGHFFLLHLSFFFSLLQTMLESDACYQRQGDAFVCRSVWHRALIPILSFIEPSVSPILKFFKRKLVSTAKEIMQVMKDIAWRGSSAGKYISLNRVTTWLSTQFEVSTLATVAEHLWPTMVCDDYPSDPTALFRFFSKMTFLILYSRVQKSCRCYLAIVSQTFS